MQAKRKDVVRSMRISVRHIGTSVSLALVCPPAYFPPCTADRARLACVRLRDFCEADAFARELVRQVLQDFPEVPVGDFLVDQPFPQAFPASFRPKVPLVPCASSPLYPLWIADEHGFHVILHAPVHKILGDFVRQIFYLSRGFDSDEPLLSLQALPSAGTLRASGLRLLDFTDFLVSESVNRTEFPPCQDDALTVGSDRRNCMDFTEVYASKNLSVFSASFRHIFALGYTVLIGNAEL